MKLRISFFVSSILSAYWNGAATYYRGLARALHARGHQLHFYEPDAFDRQAHRDMDDLPWGDVTVYDPDDWNAVKHCLREAGKADIVVKASGLGIGDEYLEAEVAALGRAAVRTVFWDVDAPATLASLEIASKPAGALPAGFDMVLCYGGGDAVCERYRALGARRCAVIYNALDPGTHFPVPKDPRFRGDLGFLGNRLPDRESRVEEFFFAAASSLSDRHFVLGGSGWDDKANTLSNVNYVGHVYTSEHNAFNLSPTAVINISRADMASTGYAPATRVFEAAGAGSCLISDTWPGLEQFLQPGEEVLVASDTDDVIDLVSNLAPQQARRIGLRARDRMLAEHTYEHRAEQVENLFLSA